MPVISFMKEWILNDFLLFLHCFLIRFTMKKIIFIGCLFCGLSAFAQSASWKGSSWIGNIDSQGCLEQIVFKDKQTNDTIPFFHKESNAGPSFYIEQQEEKVLAHWSPDGNLSYRACLNGVDCRLTYTEWNGQPAMKFKLINVGHVPFQPTKAGIRLGIDTYMDQYPDWFGKYFPTLLRNERTHFYGYMQTPANRTLAIISPDPIASWSVDYNLGYQDPAPHWFMGHRIESLNLDLMNALPLPSHNPQNLWQLKQGESKEWTIILSNIKDVRDFEEIAHHLIKAPMLNMPQTTYTAGETVSFDVLASSKAVISVVNDKRQQLPLTIKHVGEERIRVTCSLPKIGLYTVCAVDGDKISEGVLSAHSPWRWTLERAREGALRYHQKATSHVESWYGFHSAFLAARYFPSKEIDQQLRTRFDYLYELLHDSTPVQPKYYVSRIQNTSGTIGMLVDKYQAYGDQTDLVKASQLADWLIHNWQRKDGAYVNRNIVYTSVIYVAKSMLELTLAERKLGKTSVEWAEAANRHYLSAKKAIDQLVVSQGNFETEGELTFEDGMISCSALQIGLLALMQKDEDERLRYTKVMLDILNSHDCLVQLRVPDARRRGGTMRYWEAQYDVQMLPNMFNSPHGWSGWRAYATYYAYLLTGNERWLLESYNATGAFSHLIDYQSGKLHWAFVVDPYLKVRQTCEADTHVTSDSLSFGNPHPELYATQKFILGEQYVNMISDWQTVNTQDNDVHELFKFMGEAMLTNAFIVEHTDGSVKGYNCKVSYNGNRLIVSANEKQMLNLHCNLKQSHVVEFNGKKKTLPASYLGWAFGDDSYQ